MFSDDSTNVKRTPLLCAGERSQLIPSTAQALEERPDSLLIGRPEKLCRRWLRL